MVSRTLNGSGVTAAAVDVVVDESSSSVANAAVVVVKNDRLQEAPSCRAFLLVVVVVMGLLRVASSLPSMVCHSSMMSLWESRMMFPLPLCFASVFGDAIPGLFDGTNANALQHWITINNDGTSDDTIFFVS